MRTVNILAVVLLLSVAYFNGAQARSEDDLRLVGVRAVFTKVLVTNTTSTVFKTCSRARGTAFVLPTSGATGCTTCNQATGVAGSTCSGAACAFAIVPKKTQPTTCECNTASAAAGTTHTQNVDATAATDATCTGVKCQNAPATCPCVSDAVAPTGAGCDAAFITSITATAAHPGRELACVRNPPKDCTSTCSKTGPTDVGKCTAGTGAVGTACAWQIVIKEPVVACKCSEVNTAAADDTSAVTTAICPSGTLCTKPTTACVCADTTAAPTGTGCPDVPTGTVSSCVGTPPTGCGKCTTVAASAGLGEGESCPDNTACVRGTTPAACNGKRKRRNVPVNLPKDSEFDNTELGSTIDSTVPKSGDVSINDRQKRFVFTLWETSTSILQNTITTLNTATTVSLSYACLPSATNDVVESPCTG